MANFQQTVIGLITQNMDTENAPYFNSLIRDDRLFLQQRTEHFPFAIQRLLINRYKSHTDRVKANTELRHTTDKLNQLLPPVLLHNFNAGEDELRDLAQDYADICRRKAMPVLHIISEFNPEKSGVDSGDVSEISETRSLAITRAAARLSEIQPEASQPGNCTLPESSGKNPVISETVSEATIAETPQQIKDSLEICPNRVANRNKQDELLLNAYEKCAVFVSDSGMAVPAPDTHKSLSGCIKRMQDKRWWVRNLRKLMVRKTEECMLHLNKVHKHAGIYCSDLTVKNRKHQKARQLKMLESISLVNEHDQRYSLCEIYDLNISNPINRRNELMTRMRGFEDIAKELGHIGDFITLTCPSKYHCAYAKSGNRNPNWQCFTPHQGQQYLCGIWAKIRAELNRQEIRTYGLRVAEPQHDGTPHWHLMLFVEPENLKAFRAVINHYAFEEDGDEAGARENRVKFVAIDPSKGSATGYVAKYICKNIDGANLDEGVYGESPIEAAERVEAWASCWGIRQFQQIGGVSVTVWRELRRLRKLELQDITLTAIHQAADTSNWQSFVTLMGGVFCKRKEQTIRPHYDIEIDTETGQISTDYYDGFITTKLKGICYLGKAIITRLHQWRLEISQSAFCSHLEFCK